MSNDNDISVLSFPIQKKDWNQPMNLEELISNFRFEVADSFNLKAAGKFTFNLEHIEDIKMVNAICRKYGCLPIVEDLAELL